MQLKAKHIISGKIRLKTNLHIGGSKNALDIGGIDLNVIKSGKGVPFIPGSSLKGKLRSLLAKTYGSYDIKNDPPAIARLFGSSAENGQASRILVRDAHLDEIEFEGMDLDLELDWTSGKWENTIDRKTGTAQHPRQLEYVPAEASFYFEMVYNDFEDDNSTDLENLKKALCMLQDDYLGGQGSRGYGKITFENVNCTKKTIADYKEEKAGESTKWVI